MCHQLARLIDDQWLHLVAPLYGTSNSFGWSVTMAGPPRHVPLQPWVMFHWTMEEGDILTMPWWNHPMHFFDVIPIAKQLRYLFWWQHHFVGSSDTWKNQINRWTASNGLFQVQNVSLASPDRTSPMDEGLNWLLSMGWRCRLLTLDTKFFWSVIYFCTWFA